MAKKQRGLWYVLYIILKKMRILQDETVRKKIRLLGVVSQEKMEEEVLKYRKKQIGNAIIGIFILVGICILFFFQQSFQKQEPLVFERNSYGEGEKTESIYANGERIEFDVGEQKYKEEEVNAKFEEAFAYAEQNLLGENTSYDHITQDLNFDSIPNSGIEITWMPRDYELIDSEGRVQNRNFDEKQKKGVITSVVATFSYGDMIYEREYPLCIYERKLASEEVKKKQLIDKVQSYERKTRTSKEFQVPAFLQGFHLQKENKKNHIVTIVLLGVIGIICFIFVEESRMNEKIEKRNEEILMDYPTIVNQLVLYLGAGMTIRGSFFQINEDYQRKVKQKMIPKKYVYEEMDVMVHQLQSGMSQERAYYEFGQRIGLAPYIKMISFIVQNLYQGSKEILSLLEQEEQTAFDDRMERARKLGEEAGTKLLFPMILLLIVVMIIVMIPALLRFGGI